jgi:prepilin-type N-terminal cleavage/methylation domain-containing protein
MKKAFTLVEILVVMGILLVVFSMLTLNLPTLTYKANLSTSVDTFIADLRAQQLKAMVGDSEGVATASAYGVAFGTNTYTLFKGSASGSSTDYTASLGDQVIFSNVTFPSSKIVFSRLSGEVQSFTTGSNTLVIKNKANNDQKTITINQYGVVTSVQ